MRPARYFSIIQLSNSRNIYHKGLSIFIKMCKSHDGYPFILIIDRFYSTGIIAKKIREKQRKVKFLTFRRYS